jgi:hypothetical protein
LDAAAAVGAEGCSAFASNADLFVFGTGQGQDAVRDFSHAEGDHIGLSTKGGFAALSIHSAGGNSVLHLGAESVTFYGVTGLVASDFIFG